MVRLETVDVEALEIALEQARGKREAKRLIVAIIYKRGPSVPMIAEWLNIREATIYRWFDRLEEEPVEEAVRDRDRPGRPPKLDAEKREMFQHAVAHPPEASGYDEPSWSTQLAKRFLEDECGVDYTPRHVRRLMRGAGMTHRAPGSDPGTVERDERKQYWE